MGAIQFFTNVVSSVLASMGALGVLSWTLHDWISERLKNSIKHEYDLNLESHKSQLLSALNTEIETHKSKLQIENVLATEKLRADLQIIASEHQIRFARLHEKVADTIAGVHLRLSNLLRAFEMYTYPMEIDSMGSKPERRKTLIKAIEKFNSYFGSRKIYLGKELADSIEVVNDKIIKLSRDFRIHVEQGGHDISKSNETWLDVLKELRTEVKPLLDALEVEFRIRLGVN